MMVCTLLKTAFVLFAVPILRPPPARILVSVRNSQAQTSTAPHSHPLAPLHQWPPFGQSCCLCNMLNKLGRREEDGGKAEHDGQKEAVSGYQPTLNMSHLLVHSLCPPRGFRELPGAPLILVASHKLSALTGTPSSLMVSCEICKCF